MRLLLAATALMVAFVAAPAVASADCPPGFISPAATFTASPDSPQPGSVVTFDATGSTGGVLQLVQLNCSVEPVATYPIKKYSWNFGDGNTTDTPGPTVTHTYSAPGNYAPSLVVTTEGDFFSAPFSRPLQVTAPLAVTKAGAGAGTVTSAPGGIDCGATCNHAFAVSSVTLTETPAPGSAFAGWSGDCGGLAPTCVVTMERARSVTAAFGPAPPSLPNSNPNPSLPTPRKAGRCAALKGRKRSACVRKRCGQLKPHATSKRRTGYRRCVRAATRKA